MKSRQHICSDWIEALQNGLKPVYPMVDMRVMRLFNADLYQLKFRLKDREPEVRVDGLELSFRGLEWLVDKVGDEVEALVREVESEENEPHPILWLLGQKAKEARV